MTYFVMAMALVLGFTQCKKEQPTPQSQGVRITLNVNGGASTVSAAGGSKVIVNPNAPEGYATVTFEENDVIYVGNNGHYCGYLEYDGTNFTGTISDDNLSADDYLHFYFMGNKGEKSQPSSVNISDQTEKYPVISYAHSNEFYGSTESYTANLQNYCAIVKFTTTDIDADITIKGMKNTVAVDFSVNNAASSVGINHNPYTTSMTGEGDIILHAESNTERWAILLEQAEVGNATVTADGYFDGTCNVPEIANNTYHPTGVSVELVSKTIDLSKVTGNIMIPDGYTVTGTLAGNYQISIASGATVTLDGVTINGVNSEYCKWAGITCLGDATIILKEGTTNIVKGFYGAYPDIQAGPTDNTLTIKGTGSLTASSNRHGAGIGGVAEESCGNIDIQGGIITATSDGWGAGIGSGCGYFYAASCGDITISGGTVTTTCGYEGGAGIGSGLGGSCGDITITSNVTKVTSTKGDLTPYSIGAGDEGTCGTVTIGGTVYANGVDANQADGVTFVYPEPVPVINTITWNSSFISSISHSQFDDDASVSQDGITASFTFGVGLNNSELIIWSSPDNQLTFSSTVGNISKIEIYVDDVENMPEDQGWTFDGTKITWEGTPASSVSLSGNSSFGDDIYVNNISQIVFTVQ